MPCLLVITIAQRNPLFTAISRNSWTTRCSYYMRRSSEWSRPWLIWFRSLYKELQTKKWLRWIWQNTCHPRISEVIIYKVRGSKPLSNIGLRPETLIMGLQLSNCSARRLAKVLYTQWKVEQATPTLEGLIYNASGKYEWKINSKQIMRYLMRIT